MEGSIALLASAAATALLRLGPNPPVPLFSIASNLAFLAPAWVFLQHHPVAALVLVELTVASARWHWNVDDWNAHLLAADLIAMVSSGVAAVFVAVPGPQEALVGALLGVHLAQALSPPWFEKLSMPLLGAAAVAAAIVAPFGRPLWPLLLLVVPLLLPVCALHALWGTVRVNRVFRQGQDLDLTRYDAVCGTFHVAMATALCALVRDPPLAAGVAAAASAAPLVLYLLAWPGPVWPFWALLVGHGFIVLVFSVI